MSIDGAFFDAEPDSWADVPVAAMRAALRRNSAPVGASGYVPGADRQPSGSAPYTPLPAAPPLPVPAMPPPMNELGTLAGLARGLFEAIEEKPGSDWIVNFQRQLDALKGRAAGSGPGPGPGPTARRHTPLTAPDTGEVDVTDVPQGYFASNRRFESGNNPRARNPITGASGSFQFLPSTWASLIKEAPDLGLTEDGIFDDKQQDAAMRYYTSKSVQRLKPMLNRAPTGGELYTLHLLGHNGGEHVVRNQGAKLASLLPEAVFKANPWLRNYDTGRDLLEDLNKRFG